MLPVGAVEAPQGGGEVVLFRESGDYYEIAAAILPGAQRFVRKFLRSGGEFGGYAPEFLVVFLYDTCLDIAIEPGLLRDHASEFAEFFESYGDFALAYLTELRRLIRSTNKIAAAMASMRQRSHVRDHRGKWIRIDDAGDKEIANEMKIPAERVKRARQMLSQFDVKWFEREKT